MAGLLSSLGALAGNAFMPGIGGILGGALGGALESGSQTAGGMKSSQAAQDAANRAAAASQFRPVGITNTFGSSNFAYDPKTGQMTSAGYTLSPELQAYQNAIMGGTRSSLGDVTTLQNLGRGYLAQSPQEAAQQWMQGQQALLAPSREQAWSNLGTKNFNQGTTGLQVAQGGGLQAANPYASALANAQAMQDLELAAKAQQAGQQQVQFGQGLLTGAYDPFKAGLSTMGAVEGLGQQPLDIASALGVKTSTAGEKAARYISSPEAAYSSQGTLLSALGKGLAGYTGDLSGLFGGGGNTPVNLGTATGADLSLFY